MKSVSIYNNNEAGLGANATIEYRNTLYGFSFNDAGAGMPVDLPACVLAVGNMAILALLPKTDAAPAEKKYNVSLQCITAQATGNMGKAILRKRHYHKEITGGNGFTLKLI